jgi:hypothetical protein
VSTFYGLLLLSCGIPALAASCAALRVARGRAEENVAWVALVLCTAAVVTGGMLIG